MPSFIKKKSLISEREITKQLQSEARLAKSGKEAFDAYAEKWWTELKEKQKAHKKHLIKIFVETDDRDQ